MKIALCTKERLKPSKNGIFSVVCILHYTLCLRRRTLLIFSKTGFIEGKPPYISIFIKHIDICSEYVDKSKFSKHMSWNPEKPYNDLPLLPPGIELETKAVLKQCIAARAALAELKQAAELITLDSTGFKTYKF